MTTTLKTTTVEALMSEPYFSINRDNQIIANGGMWCLACLSRKPANEHSKDERYCSQCYDYLSKEGEILSEGSHPRWIPKASTKCYNAKLDASKQNIGNHNHHKQNEVLVQSKSSTAQAYQNPTEERPKPSVGGRPRKEVPTELIYELSDKGMSIGGIVKELKTQGISLSALTIQRVLAGRKEKG